MKRRPQAYTDWLRIVTSKMPHLSKPQAVVLTMWSFGIAVTHCCGLSTISVFLAELLDKKENTVRQQLREWYKQRSEQDRRKRSELDVSASFVPLLQWVLSWWPPQEKNLVLAADASTLGDRFTLLVIGVVYRGCGIPVAWAILKGNAKGSWKPHWLRLIDHLQPAIPSDWFVIVTTDRGLYAKWLYDAIVALNWHPFMRINDQGHYQLKSQEQFVPLKGLITSMGQSWAGIITCFKANPLECTLLARWDEGYSDPWLILTDLEPHQAEILWYAMRSWIECLFKDIKRGGFKWHLTRISDPKRVERVWLAIAVATLWLVSVGGEADARLEVSSLKPLAQPQSNAGVQSPSESEPNSIPQSIMTSPPRLLSCFRRGFLMILAAAFKGEPLPIGSFVPDFSAEPIPVPIFNSG